MIGSQGINDLSRAAGDESLQRLQRINKDSHNEQDKEKRGRGREKSSDEKEQAGDSFERTAENVRAEAAQGIESTPTLKITEVADSVNKSQNKSDAGSPKTSGENESHIDLVG